MDEVALAWRERIADLERFEAETLRIKTEAGRDTEPPPLTETTQCG